MQRAIVVSCVVLWWTWGCSTGGVDAGRVAVPQRSPELAAAPGREAAPPRPGAPARAAARTAAGPDSEHPFEPRRAEDEPHVFRSAGRGAPSRVTLAPTFQPGTPGAPQVFYGLMHAHTLYSDGSGTPAAAFERARNAGLDFMAVSSHNHARAELGAEGPLRDGVLIANDHELYEGAGDVTFTRFEGSDDEETGASTSVIRAADDATEDGSFVAFFAQEFSAIGPGNHVNVVGVDEVITVPNGDFAPLYSQLGGPEPPVVQMNHPDIHRDLFYRGQDQDVLDDMFNDYGFDEFGEDFGALVAAADPLISLIEVLTGPAKDDEIHPSFHYPSRLVHDADYYYYLIQGFHLSPSVGQDNHFETWGDSTPARMGVFASELTRDGLMTAMRSNRTFATEDPDLRAELAVNGQPMGSVLTLAAGAPLDITVEVADESEPGASYVVELFYGDVAPQRRATLVKFVPEDGFAESFSFDGDGVLTFDEFLASGKPEFFFALVTQGDGDRAWTAPVWINHPRP